jgi:hypothetical protein
VNRAELPDFIVVTNAKKAFISMLVLQVLTFNTNHGVVTDNVIASYECIARKLIANNSTTGS